MAGCAAVVAAGAMLGVPGSAQAATTAPVPGTVSPAVRILPRAGTVPASGQLTVQVWLTPDLAGAAAFADAVATPGSAEFHHYLRPDGYTARFGPSAAHAKAVAQWLSAEGLTRVDISRGRDYVSATGPVSTVQSAFRVRINRYRTEDANGTPTVVQSNDRDVSVPASLAPDVLGVTGMSGARPATSQSTTVREGPGRPLAAAPAPTCSQYWAQHTHTLAPAYRGVHTVALPVCGYSAAQIRAAYGANWTDTGKGQTVALTEEESPTAMYRTLKEYARRNHLPAPKPSQFREVRSATTCRTAPHRTTAAPAPAVDDEAEMDSEAVYTMAPGADQLMVIGGGCDEDQALLDAAVTVLTGDGRHPGASIVSNSWQIPLGAVPERTVHAIDVRAAAEGVGMYFASGDTPGLTVTDSDPYAVAVGGTSLGIGAAGNRVFETGWSDDYGSLDHGTWTDLGVSAGGGGGTSLVHAQPAYQKGVVPASMSRVRVGQRVATNRAVPDLAADGDPDTGLLTGYTESGDDARPGPYRTMVNGGTSLACPLIAGLVADAQQGRKSPFGFSNPLIYRLAGTRAYHDVLPIGPRTPQQDRGAYVPSVGPGGSPGVDLFDVQDHASTEQVTAKGYDTMTGVGTPDGAAFIAGLRRLAP
ncbi:protease pro-enzyme activation domain-containing protein [Streptomyces sp. CoH27]|uniref:S53 family peptidase n=1 Tax=Streptomyces sp. CoH27 TaxID=2875763 RepID=UPI001CD25BC5|nr:protease pro-enzyme activation domain-containing protein [Streptomyces sp. CoH27]